MSHRHVALPVAGSESSSPELQVRQSKLGGLCWLFTVPRPNICARLARFPAKLNGLKVIDIYRINDLIKTVKKWQSECALKYFAGLLQPVWRALSCPDAEWGESRPIPEDSMLLVGWSDAASGTHTQDGRCRLGYIIGLMSPTLAGSDHTLQWTSMFTRRHVESSLGGEIFAFSVMRGHIEIIREFYFSLGHERLGSYELSVSRKPGS